MLKYVVRLCLTRSTVSWPSFFDFSCRRIHTIYHWKTRSTHFTQETLLIMYISRQAIELLCSLINLHAFLLQGEQSLFTYSFNEITVNKALLEWILPMQYFIFHIVQANRKSWSYLIRWWTSFLYILVYFTCSKYVFLQAQVVKILVFSLNFAPSSWKIQFRTSLEET